MEKRETNKDVVRADRKSYESPRLTVHGTVRRLTAGGTSALTETQYGEMVG